MTARPFEQGANPDDPRVQQGDANPSEKAHADDGPADRQAALDVSADSGSIMRFARMMMRRKPVLILLVLSICLVLTILYSWQLIRNGDVSGLILVGANLCAFVIALVYLADDLLRR